MACVDWHFYTCTAINTMITYIYRVYMDCKWHVYGCIWRYNL